MNLDKKYRKELFKYRVNEWIDKHFASLLITVLILGIIILSVFLNNAYEDMRKEAHEQVTEICEFSGKYSTLVYDNETKVVYIQSQTHGSYFVYSPYYSENGKLCIYIDGEIQEIH